MRRAEEDRILFVAAFKDPLKEMDKLHELYETLRDAREQLGEQNVPFHKFTELVKSQVDELKKDGAPEVAFRVSVKNGKLNFTARGLKGDEVKQGRLARKRGSGADPISGARRNCGLGLGDVTGLWSLGSVNDFELDGLSLFQGPEAGTLNGGVVDEDVAAALAFDEPITLGVVEPLDLACDTHRSSSLPYVRREYRELKKKDRNGAAFR